MVDFELMVDIYLDSMTNLLRAVSIAVLLIGIPVFIYKYIKYKGDNKWLS